MSWESEAKAAFLRNLTPEQRVERRRQQRLLSACRRYYKNRHNAKARREIQEKQEAKRAYQREWRQRNLETSRAYWRAWAVRNRESYLAKMRERARERYAAAKAS